MTATPTTTQPALQPAPNLTTALQHVAATGHANDRDRTRAGQPALSHSQRPEHNAKATYWLHQTYLPDPADQLDAWLMLAWVAASAAGRLLAIRDGDPA